MTAPLSISPSASLHRQRLVVGGELDRTSAPQLLAAIEAALTAPGCRDVVLDLTAVTFADPSSMAALTQGFLACRRVGGRLTAFGATGTVAEVLASTGIGELAGPVLRRTVRRPTAGGAG